MNLLHFKRALSLRLLPFSTNSEQPSVPFSPWRADARNVVAVQKNVVGAVQSHFVHGSKLALRGLRQIKAKKTKKAFFKKELTMFFFVYISD